MTHILWEDVISVFNKMETFIKLHPIIIIIIFILFSFTTISLRRLLSAKVYMAAAPFRIEHSSNDYTQNDSVGVIGSDNHVSFIDEIDEIRVKLSMRQSIDRSFSLEPDDLWSDDLDESPALYSNPPNVLPPLQGTIAWTPPQRTRVGKVERIEIRLADPSVAQEELLKRISRPSVAKVDKLELSSRMRVKLIVDPQDFEVRSLSSEDQWLKPGSVVAWDYDVVALRSGTRHMRLLVTMRVTVEEKEDVLDLPSYDHDVFIEISPIYTATRFTKTNWQWILGAFAVPLGWMLVHSGAATGAINWGRREIGLPAVASSSSSNSALTSATKKDLPEPRPRQP